MATFSNAATTSSATQVKKMDSPSTAGDTALNDNMDALNSRVPSAAMLVGSTPDTMGITIDGQGSLITSGVKGSFIVPTACTIKSVSMVSDVSGSIQVEIWQGASLSVPTSSAAKINASAPATLSSAQTSQDSTLTGWTTSLAANDVIVYNVISTSITLTKVTLVLNIWK